MERVKISSVVFPGVVSKFDRNYQLFVGNGWEVHYSSEKKANKAARLVDREATKYFFNCSKNLAELYGIWKNFSLQSFSKNEVLSKMFLNADLFLVSAVRKNYSNRHKSDRLFYAMIETKNIAEKMLLYYPLMDKNLERISDIVKNELKNFKALGSDLPESVKIVFSDFSALVE